MVSSALINAEATSETQEVKNFSVPNPTGAKSEHLVTLVGSHFGVTFGPGQD